MAIDHNLSINPINSRLLMNWIIITVIELENSTFAHSSYAVVHLDYKLPSRRPTVPPPLNSPSAIPEIMSSQDLEKADEITALPLLPILTVVDADASPPPSELCPLTAVVAVVATPELEATGSANKQYHHSILLLPFSLHSGLTISSVIDILIFAAMQEASTRTTNDDSP